MSKSEDALRTIGEVAEALALPHHVLRFWETRFTAIKPLKRSGARRYYRPEDVALVTGIRRLLYDEGYTIKGVQRILRERGQRHVQAIGRGEAEAPAPAPEDAEGMVEAAAVPGPPDPPGEAGPSRAALPTGDARAALLAILDELTACRALLATVAPGDGVVTGEALVPPPP